MSLESLIATGTKLWLDSVDPELVVSSRAVGATGATSNPVIVSDLIKSGRFDQQLRTLMGAGLTDEEIAWQMTDDLVQHAQQVFHPVWQSTSGNDGYVSFEVDPLLEDDQLGLSHEERVEQYLQLAQQWARGHQNRMIKVPATAAGLAAVEELAAAGLTLNVTLIFTLRQYHAARDAIWRGAQRRANGLALFKSVYSIFVSRVDVYTAQHVPQLTEAAQGLVGIVNAKRLWQDNRQFWADKSCPLDQEIIFASTGTKNPEDTPDKYVRAFAGSDIETNPPATNDYVAANSTPFTRQVDILPSEAILAEIDAEVDMQHLEDVLMDEGIRKFADPQRDLLNLIGEKRAVHAA
ncbi:MAG: transaldolase [Planctomycetales bacterium]|nr:transaldolase [Planctomycetales bacterium]